MMQPETTEAKFLTHLHSHLRKDSINFQRYPKHLQRNSRGSFLNLRMRIIKPRSVATAKPKRHILKFERSCPKFPNYSYKIHENATKTSGDQSQKN